MTLAQTQRLCGAIDLGGTKIEARLFGAEMQTIDLRRTPTPVADFPSFLDGLSDQIGWLLDQAGTPDLPVGICVPGIIDRRSGECFASNVPISGRRLGTELAARFGRDYPIANDCMALAYSETHGGAGDAFGTVVGLVLGTGVGAGLCVDGEIPERHAGLVLEIGHTGMPARALARHGLPVWRCGCGQEGCMEMYMAGSALSRLWAWKGGTGERSGEALVDAAAAGDALAAEVLDIWVDLVAECLQTLQLVLDPDCIVLGGGASRMAGIAPRLTAALKARQLGTLHEPALCIARHGDSSGARGMALMALNRTA